MGLAPVVQVVEDVAGPFPNHIHHLGTLLEKAEHLQFLMGVWALFHCGPSYGPHVDE